MQRTRIQDMQFEKGKLLNPFHGIGPIQDSNYSLNIIPELLRIDSVLKHYSIFEIKDELFEFLSICSQNINNNETFLGNISDFEKIIDKTSFIEKNKYLVQRLIIQPFGDIITLYPTSPMSYFTSYMGYKQILSKEITLEQVSDSLTQLYDGKSNYSSLRRFVQFTIGVSKGFIRITKEIFDSKVDMFVHYPNLSEEELSQCNQFIYMILNTSSYGLKNSNQWAHSFWEQNLLLSKCQ